MFKNFFKNFFSALRNAWLNMVWSIARLFRTKKRREKIMRKDAEKLLPLFTLTLTAFDISGDYLGYEPYVLSIDSADEPNIYMRVKHNGGGFYYAPVKDALDVWYREILDMNLLPFSIFKYNSSEFDELYNILCQYWQYVEEGTCIRYDGFENVVKQQFENEPITNYGLALNTNKGIFIICFNDKGIDCFDPNISDRNHITEGRYTQYILDLTEESSPYYNENPAVHIRNIAIAALRDCARDNGLDENIFLYANLFGLIPLCYKDTFFGYINNDLNFSYVEDVFHDGELFRIIDEAADCVLLSHATRVREDVIAAIKKWYNREMTAKEFGEIIGISESMVYKKFPRKNTPDWI